MTKKCVRRADKINMVFLTVSNFQHFLFTLQLFTCSKIYAWLFSVLITEIDAYIVKHQRTNLTKFPSVHFPRILYYIPPSASFQNRCWQSYPHAQIWTFHLIFPVIVNLSAIHCPSTNHGVRPPQPTLVSNIPKYMNFLSISNLILKCLLSIYGS